MIETRTTVAMTLALATLFAAPTSARADDEDGRERVLELIEKHLADADGRAGGMNRLSDVDTASDAAVAVQVARKLGTQKMTINFDGVPLLEALDFFRDVTGINIVVSAQARAQIEDEAVTVKLRLKDIRAKNAFELTLRSHEGLVYGIRHGVLTIALEEEFETRLRLKIYFVQDLIKEPEDFPAPKLDLSGLNGDD